MKLRLAVLMIAVLATLSSYAQFITIPDSMLRVYIEMSEYEDCLVGTQLDTTCAELHVPHSLRCYYPQLNPLPMDNGVRSIEGVQYIYGLQTLDCKNNKIASINSLPPNLWTLITDNNPIAALPTLPSTLKYLQCNFDSLTSLPALTQNIYYISVNNNLLTALPVLPNILQTLECNYNNLANLPALPNTLNSLRCQYNQITSLPELPNGIITVECDYNQLTYLPSLNKPSLNRFTCNYNSIDSLPDLHENLRYLYCRKNNIKVIPNIPQYMNVIVCDSNNLQSINSVFPNLYTRVVCNANPNLTCFPICEHIHNIEYQSTGITCRPTLTTFYLAVPPIDSLPTCGTFNENGCSPGSNVNGKIYMDIDSNCTITSIDSKVHNVKIELLRNNITENATYSYSDGYYAMVADTLAIYKVAIDTNGLPFEVMCPDSGFYNVNIVTGNNLHNDKHFGVRCKLGFDLSVKSIVSPDVFRPANISEVYIKAGDVANFYNVRCALDVPGSLKIVLNGPVTYVGPAQGALAPDSINGDTILWNIADFGAVDVNTDFKILVQTDTFAQSEQSICFNAIIASAGFDRDSSNNIFLHCFDVVNSFDPNDKQVYPMGEIVKSQQWLTYTVRFQNTGTAEAQHIYVMDTLDENVDASTFDLLAYSHQPNVVINKNVVRFNFPNINLPDSNTNEDASHGYIQYRVKVKGDLVNGTEINNTAYIYFDFNAPVITNTVVNTVLIPEDTVVIGIPKMDNFKLQLFPNPSPNIVRILTDIEGKYIVRLFNTRGALLSTQTVSSKESSINLAEFANGVYYIEVQDADNNVMRKRILKL